MLPMTDDGMFKMSVTETFLNLQRILRNERRRCEANEKLETMHNMLTEKEEDKLKFCEAMSNYLISHKK